MRNALAPRRRFPTLAAATAFLLCMTAVGPAAAEFDGGPIAKLTVDGDEVDRPALLEVLGLEIGGDIDRHRLRDAVLTAYASSEIEWIRIEAAETPEGLDVAVHVSVRPRVERLDVEIGNRVLRNRIRKWLEIAPGDVATTAAVEASERRVKRRLRELGYRDPDVAVYLDYNRPTNTVVVSVSGELGLPTTVNSIALRGIDDPEIAAEVTPRAKTGKKIDLRYRENLRQQVEDRLKEAGYWEAEVLRIELLGDGASVDLVVHVGSGDRYEMELVVPEEHRKALLNAIPDPKKEEVHPQQTDALAERVRERLQEAGYLLAEVDAELITGGELPVLRITAEPGAVRKIIAIDFPGAESLSTKVLRTAVSVHPGAVRGLRGQDVSAGSLERDRLAVIDLYRSRGFPEATVGTPFIEAVGGDAALIAFPVDEGLRWTLTDLTIEGLPAETVAALERRPLPMVEASPWDPRQVEEARRWLEGLLADTGYPDGRASAEIDASRLGEASVILIAEPGQFVRIGKVVVAGLKRTDPSVVDRILRRTGITEGEPFSRSQMLEAQQQLYEIALFRRVELLPMPGQERHSERGLVVLLEEGLHKSYLVGLGWNETDRFRVTLGWYHLNLFGGAHAVSAETVLSSREQRFQLGVREPRLPWIDVPGYLVIYQTFEDFPSYSQRRRGLWIDLGDRYRLPFRTWWRYEYQLVQPENLPSGAPPEEQEARISSLTPTLEWDFRDNPLVPTGGSFSEVSLSYAFPFLEADSEFLKLQGRTTFYGEIANGRGAVGIRLGAIEPLGGDTGEPANIQVPINTRFFAGGANTHRAFAWDTLGIPGQTINDDGEAIGGNALVLINAEYVRKLTGPFSGHLFIDAGNVWESPDLVRFEDIRWGAGLGFSLDTPAGPIRLEYGWKLDREPGESPGEWWISFGIPF